MVYVSILRQPRRCVLSIVFDCRRRNLGRPIKEPVCRCYCHTDSRRGDGCFGGPERNRTAVRQQSLRLHTAIFLGGIPFTRLTRITFGTEFTDYRRGPWCLNDQNLIRGVTTAQPSITLTVGLLAPASPCAVKSDDSKADCAVVTPSTISESAESRLKNLLDLSFNLGFGSLQICRNFGRVRLFSSKDGLTICVCDPADSGKNEQQNNEQCHETSSV